MPNPREVIISLTNRCNFKCRMCDIPHNKFNELSTLQWKRVIEDAALCGAEAIVFSGGEPLLREDILELISAAKAHSMGACLTSNGSLIDDAIAQELKQAGVDVVNVSIEGPRHIHDYLRGKGTFDKAISALESLHKHKIESTIATAISRYNYKYLSSIIEFAKSYSVTTIKFQPFSNIFLKNRLGGEDFLISDKDISRFAEVVHNAIILTNKYSIATNPSSYLKAIPFYLTGKYKDPHKGCIALENSCPINCNGDIYPCWVNNDETHLIGNIRDDSFSNLWTSQKRRLIIQQIKEYGCPGCMMSCYEDNFSKNSIDKRIIMNIRQLRKKGISRYVIFILRKMIRRLKFYGSYRGSLRGLLKRFCGSLQSRKNVKMKSNKAELEQVLKELEIIKQVLEGELGQSKPK